MTSLADLTTPMTVAEATAAIYAALAARGVTTTTWKAGSVVRTIIAALAIILAALSQLQANLARSGFLALATGAWLRLVALYVYGVTANEGSFATGTITLTNAAGGVFSKAAYAVTFSNGAHTYRNTAAFSLGSFGTVDVPIAADALGAASSTGGATITTLVTPMPGVTSSNAAALVGLDPEDDAALRIRCAEKLGTLSPNGAPDAYAFVARTAVDATGASLGITRVKTVPDGIGGLDLYVATPSAGVSGTVGDLATPLGIVDDLIQRQVVPRAITCRTHTATTLAVDYSYELWIPDTEARGDAAIHTAVDAAVAAFVSARPIGGDVITPPNGYVFASAIADVIGSVVPGTIKSAVTVPAADLAVGASAAPVPGHAVVPGTIHRVHGATI